MIINTKDDLKKFSLALANHKICNGNEILNILANNIEKIYDMAGIYGIQKIMEFIPNLSEISPNNKSLIVIDSFLANNIDEIYKNECKGYIFYFECFMKMERFKKRIKEKGIDFFINVPLRNYKYLEGFKDIAESIFGEFTIEHFTKMKFGQNDSQKALIIQTIIEELLEQSGTEAKMENIEEIREGGYSQVYRVGNYVLKVGDKRINNKIPNDRRILQSIIKVEIPPIDNNINPLIIEVQNLVDADWYKDMSEEQIYEALFEIYAELRKKGIIWVDVRTTNVGRLLKKNTSHILYVDINNRKKQIKPCEEGTGLIGEASGETLEAGDLVILDNDGLIREEDLDSFKRKDILFKSEYGYGFWIRYKNMVEEQRGNRGIEKNRD